MVLRVLPGHREVLGFCNDQRLEQIGQHLRPILGRRVRVTLQQPGAAGDTADDADAPARRAGPTTADRRAAMNLPLVQRVLENFPDATLIDARDEAELPPPPAEAATDAESADDEDESE
ncbi:MAG: hypothetical protein ACODAQ_11405 [Phycisphaeraceae bacterium]